MDRILGILTPDGTEQSSWRPKEPTKAWPTFKIVVTLPSQPETRARDRGVGMRNGGECSAFYGREGEFLPSSPPFGISLTEAQ